MRDPHEGSRAMETTLLKCDINWRNECVRRNHCYLTSLDMGPSTIAHTVQNKNYKTRASNEKFAYKRCLLQHLVILKVCKAVLHRPLRAVVHDMCHQVTHSTRDFNVYSITQTYHSKFHRSTPTFLLNIAA